MTVEELETNVGESPILAEATELHEVIIPKPSEPMDIPKRKPRKPMTPEHKEKLLKALTKAREISKIKRGKTAQAKKILKEEKNRETDEIIRKSLMVKDKPDTRDEEIINLKNKINKLTLQEVIKEPKKVKKVSKKVEKELEEIPEEPPQIKYTNLRGKKNKRK